MLAALDRGDFTGFDLRSTMLPVLAGGEYQKLSNSLTTATL